MWQVGAPLLSTSAEAWGIGAGAYRMAANGVVGKVGRAVGDAVQKKLGGENRRDRFAVGSYSRSVLVSSARARSATCCTARSWRSEAVYPGQWRGMSRYSRSTRA